MALDPRLEELLERYPSEVTDAELAEIRAAAERDPSLEALLEALLLVDATFAGTDLDPELSPEGQRKLDAKLETLRAWTVGPAAPTEARTEDGPKAWTLGPAAPTEARADNVIDFASARRKRMRMVGLAIAAVILVALGFAVRGWFGPKTEGGGYDPYGGGVKGDDDSAEPDVEGQIQIMGAVRITDGDSAPADEAVRFTIRLEDSASIALVEVQGDVTAVIWPPPGHQWIGTVGNNPLAPPGSDGTYKPARSGAAEYVLVAKTGELRVDAPLLTTLDGFIDDNDAEVLDRVTVRWTEGDSTP